MLLNTLKKYCVKPKKSLWQNFLVNEKILENISSFLDISWKNTIEIWPGYWALTEKLLNKKPKSLTLVELDKNMVNILKLRIDNWELDISWIDFEIRNENILSYNFSIPTSYYVIANIPYYITSPIIRHFLYDIENIPENMLILMQKDVTDKILWSKKNKSSILSLFINKKCSVKEILLVSKKSFIPIPKVDSSVLFFRHHNLYNYMDDNKFLNIVKKWFIEPRKKLIKNLTKWWFNKKKILDLFNKLWFWENIRAEDLSIEDWVKLISLI